MKIRKLGFLAASVASSVLALMLSYMPLRPLGGRFHPMASEDPQISTVAPGGLAQFASSASREALPTSFSLSTAYSIPEAQGAPEISSPSRACGGPITYCSRTDVNIVQKVSPTPNVGGLTGAGTCVTPSDFGNQICRITDANTRPESLNDTFVASADGNGNANMFNTDSTLIIIGEPRGNNSIPMAFDPTTMKASRLYLSSFRPTGGMVFADNNLGQWSRVNSQWLYRLVGTKLLKYDFTHRKSPPTPKLVFDFASTRACLRGISAIDWHSPLDIGANDSAFGAGFGTAGSQDYPGDYYVVNYQPGKGCRMLNLSNDMVTGDYGVIGKLTYNTGKNNLCYMHGARMNMSGDWMHIDCNKCTGDCDALGTPHWWHVSTLDGYVMANCTGGGKCPAHLAMNETTFFTSINRGFEYVKQINQPLSTAVRMVADLSFAVPFDSHDSWNNYKFQNPGGDNPVFSSTFNVNGEQTTFTHPWEAEIVGWTIHNAPGPIYRFAHHYNTGMSQRFATSEAIGAGSQDGKLFMFTSDWQGTLGSEAGSSTCTLGGPKDGTGCRGDLFIVRLN